MASGLPFSREQFLAVFAAFNARLWPVVALLWLVSGVIFWWSGASSSRSIRWLLAALWISSAVYHAAFFSAINPAAWLFAALFVAQAALFLTHPLRFDALSWRDRPAAFGLAVCGLSYPVLTLVAGERYPEMPVYAVPCPTVLVTAGLLLAARWPFSRWIAAIPIAWGVIGGSAALLLGMRVDLALFAAAALLAWRIRPRPTLRVPAAHV